MFLEWVNSLVLSFLLSEIFQKLENKNGPRSFIHSLWEIRIPLALLFVVNIVLSDYGSLLVGDVALNLRAVLHVLFRFATHPIHLLGFVTGSSLLYAFLISAV